MLSLTSYLHYALICAWCTDFFVRCSIAYLAHFSQIATRQMTPTCPTCGGLAPGAWHFQDSLLRRPDLRSDRHSGVLHVNSRWLSLRSKTRLRAQAGLIYLQNILFITMLQGRTHLLRTALKRLDDRPLNKRKVIKTWSNTHAEQWTALKASKGFPRDRDVVSNHWYTTELSLFDAFCGLAFFISWYSSCVLFL